MRSLKTSVGGYELFESGGLIMAERETRGLESARDTRGPFYSVGEARRVLSHLAELPEVGVVGQGEER